MGLLDKFKKKPKEAPGSFPAVPPTTLPTDYIYSMRQQGYSDDQIMEELQRQGFTYQQIYDAMNQISAATQAEPYSPPMQHELATAPESQENFEEIAESIIEEKWHDFTRDLGKINEWKELVNSRLDRLEQSLTDLKSDIENLHKAIVSKISDYDRNLLDVGTEIKAMEKVFQKVLPTLTENINELSRITKGVKASKKKESSK